ncbi:unnamed protein product [Rotaria sordida]|uniref:Uncharacterized protein n=1 Tax=Rotaria sordida TaxID=392033 RepID=A0A814UBZ8_9BILA|nr:unnamed protein product [Rotaria sordida]
MHLLETFVVLCAILGVVSPLVATTTTKLPTTTTRLVTTTTTKLPTTTTRLVTTTTTKLPTTTTRLVTTTTTKLPTTTTRLVTTTTTKLPTTTTRLVTTTTTNLPITAARLVATTTTNEESILINDPFWNQFLSFRLQSPFTTAHSKLLDESCLIYLQQFVLNNPKTNNYGTLIEVFNRLANVIRDEYNNNIIIHQTYNSLFILRLITKYFIEIDSEQNFYPYFLPQDISTERISLMTIFVDTLFRTTIMLPVDSSTYGLHLEVLNTLLSLLSIQMCAKEAIFISSIYSIFMHRLDPLLISEFTRTLLEHFIKQIECPPFLAADSTDGSKNESGSLFKIGQTVASSLWSVVTLGMSSSSTSTATEGTATSIDSIKDLRNRHLSNQSIHLLLILSNHFTNDIHRNPYRLALLHFTDTQDSPTNLPDSEPLPWFSIDYHRLYDVLCQTVHTDQSTLLLYLLLHRNQHFKAYVISRTNIDQIVLPVLRVIYTSTEQNSHHIYMSLIILLILSEDDFFNRTIHDIKLKKLTWYEVCAYLEQTSHGYSERGDAQLSKRFLDDAAILYERAIQTYMRSNMLIHFAYADFEEQRLNIDKARSIYNRLLDINEANLKDPTLAYIQAMRFERRTDGIKSARTLFKRAREDIRTNHQIYVAAALMEYYCTKDNNIAFNIFNLGLKKYNQNLDYILAYIDYMTHLNEDHNARVLFERILSPNNSIFKQLQPTIWNEFLKFESQVGDLQSIKKVEKRRLKIYSDLNELEGRETLLLVDRYKFLNLLPCSIDELKLLGCKDLSNINLSSTNTSVLTNGSIVNGTTLLEQAVRDRRAILPRPDIKHMMPFRPTRKPLPGSHPTPGGAFPLPDTALYLVKVLPPARNFEGPFVIIDELMERVTRITIPDSFDPIRFSIQGEVIRDLDSSNTNTSQQNRKTGHGDSDDEEQQAPLNVSERSTMDIYRQRQQKRVKLTKTNSTDQLQSLQRIATMTCFEDLSGEILMIIFEYMDVEDLWTIFFNMNTRFNTLVFDSRLRLTANISKIDKTKFDQFCLSLFQTNCNNIFILILSNNYYRYPQIRQFLFHTTFMYFQSLYSLILIDINYDELMKITNQIKQLSNLNHLHVNTHEIYHDKQLMNITQELFNQPNIHVLGLDFHEKIQWYDIKTISLSNIEVLSLNFINIDRLFLLLTYCPHLRSLSMTLDSRCNSLITNDNSESLSQSTITYPQITSLRFYFRSFNVSALQRLLNALPSLKRFSIDTLMYKEDYIRASFWTLLLQQRLPLLERVRLVLRGFFGLESNEKINENRKTFIGGYQYDQYWLDRAHKKIFTCYTNDTSMVLQIR